jgi:hypothetical protein
MNHEKFNGATFQILTGFDCIPILPDTANPLTIFGGEQTESAKSAMATAPATVYRWYLRNSETVNLLDETPLKVSNGIAYFDDGDGVESFDWSDLSRYKVGVQRRCPVILRPNLRYFQRVPTSQQSKVHQIFCSALNFSVVEKSALTIRIAEFLLEAQYRATILAASENARLFPDAPGARILFLTLLGCREDFDNPPDLVCRAIFRCRDVIANSGLQIYLVCKGDVEFEAASTVLHNFVEEFKGEIIKTTPVEDEIDLIGSECSCGSGVFIAGGILLVAFIMITWSSFIIKNPPFWL